MPEPIEPGVRAELDQTPEWWDRQYRTLVRKHIPRDAASHEGHRIIDLSTYATARHACDECGIEIDPHQPSTSDRNDS